MPSGERRSGHHALLVRRARGGKAGRRTAGANGTKLENEELFVLRLQGVVSLQLPGAAPPATACWGRIQKEPDCSAQASAAQQSTEKHSKASWQARPNSYGPTWVSHPDYRNSTLSLSGAFNFASGKTRGRLHPNAVGLPTSSFTGQLYEPEAAVQDEAAAKAADLDEDWCIHAKESAKWDPERPLSRAEACEGRRVGLARPLCLQGPCPNCAARR